MLIFEMQVLVCCFLLHLQFSGEQHTVVIGKCADFLGCSGFFETETV